MADLPFALFFALVLIFMVVVYSSAVAAAHTDAQLPKALLYGSMGRRTGRQALIVEVTFGVLLLGSGQVIVLLLLVHPGSTIPVRLVATAQLLAAGVWFAYLRRLISR